MVMSDPLRVIRCRLWSFVVCLVVVAGLCGAGDLLRCCVVGGDECEKYASHMTRSEVMKLLREKRWTVSAVADRWGYSRRHVTACIANEGRGQLWNDAFLGLPEGPGFYRVGVARVAPKGRFDLVVGSLVASESDMYTFDYGARGVVVEELGRDRWLVVWDGGGEMEIDADCLSQWVMDLGIELPQADRLRRLPVEERIALVNRLNING